MSQPSNLLSAREARRAELRTLAIVAALEDHVTLSCRKPSAARNHTTCAGLEAFGTELGCLCECHDEQIRQYEQLRQSVRPCRCPTCKGTTGSCVRCGESDGSEDGQLCAECDQALEAEFGPK